MKANSETSFWARTYSVRNHTVILNFYFGETKLSEFDAVVNEAGKELADLGLTLSPEATFLSTNRAGMFLSCRVPFFTDEAGLQSFVEKLDGQNWKTASN